MQRLSTTLILTLLTVLAAACAPEPAVTPATGTTTTASIPADARVVASGTFDGRNDHVVSGTVEVVESGGKMFVRLGSDFSLDGAPDPKIGFGRGGEYDTSTTFTELGPHTGASSYALPDGFALGDLGEAYIWCDQFSVALGVAELK